MTETERLKQVVEKLRAEDGCPWDRAQTHASLKAPCIEEAAEVIAGINILESTGNADNLREELGDMLLQVVFHAVIAEEEGLFDLDDVMRSASEKMIRRHPHVFGGVNFASEEERKASWEKIKKEEKQGREWQEAYFHEALKESEKLIEVARKRKEPK
ncbi:MAG: nucleotide pyrophosphohydrolase [Lachnospiraceae bacterium]|nr:nucleotide pyrophosphohydrolase [Lachnospiraceae bacterium]